MKPISQLIPRDPPQDELDRMLLRESRNSSERAQKEVEIAQLWQLMGSMFGHRWTTAYGDQPDPDRVWYSTLKDLSFDQMKKGMGEVANQCLEWPPSAPQFRKMCLGEPEHWAHKRIASANAQEATKALPNKRSEETKTKASSFISELRKGL